ENISPPLVRLLAEIDVYSQSAPHIGLAGRADHGMPTVLAELAWLPSRNYSDQFRSLQTTTMDCSTTFDSVLLHPIPWTRGFLSSLLLYSEFCCLGLAFALVGSRSQTSLRLRG